MSALPRDDWEAYTEATSAQVTAAYEAPCPRCRAAAHQHCRIGNVAMSATPHWQRYLTPPPTGAPAPAQSSRNPAQEPR